MDLSTFDWGYLIIAIFALFLSISLHETAHGYVAYLRGDDTAKRAGRLTLNPIAHVDIFGTIIFPLILFLTHLPVIGWAKPVPVNVRNLKNPRKDELLVALAGPFSNILLGFFFFFVLFGSVRVLNLNLAKAVLINPIIKPIFLFLVFCMQINFLLAFFNLIPIPPLDGATIVEYFIPYQYREAYYRMRFYGFFILILLFIFLPFSVIFYPVQLLISYLSKFIFY